MLPLAVVVPEQLKLWLSEGENDLEGVQLALPEDDRLPDKLLDAEAEPLPLTEGLKVWL